KQISLSLYKTAPQFLIAVSVKQGKSFFTSPAVELQSSLLLTVPSSRSTVNGGQTTVVFNWAPANCILITKITHREIIFMLSVLMLYLLLENVKVYGSKFPAKFHFVHSLSRQ